MPPLAVVTPHSLRSRLSCYALSSPLTSLSPLFSGIVCRFFFLSRLARIARSCSLSSSSCCSFFSSSSFPVAGAGWLTGWSGVGRRPLSGEVMEGERPFTSRREAGGRYEVEMARWDDRMVAGPADEESGATSMARGDRRTEWEM